MVDLAAADLDRTAAAAVREWLRDHEVRVLNVAGPRESSAPGIAAEAAAFLRSVFERNPYTLRVLPGIKRRRHVFIAYPPAMSRHCNAARVN